MEVTLKVTAVFESLSVPYLIGGSLASALYGMVRTTQDSNIVAEMQLEHLQAFVSSLQDEFYMDDAMIAASIQHNSSFNIIHRETMFKVDVFIPPWSFLSHAPENSPFCHANCRADDQISTISIPVLHIFSKLHRYTL